jgi:4-hydroxy-tetrahydrodipicolinate synthase
MVTPFDAAGALDLARLEALVEWQVHQGIDFLVPCGSTGEAATMTPEERAAVTATVVRVAAGRLPVMAGATDNDTRRAVDEAKRQRDAGAGLILTACPFYNKPTQAGLIRHFTAIADAVDVPIVLYNIPGRTGVNLLPETVGQLAMHHRIRGIKESSGDLRQIQHLLTVCPDGFAVLSGDDWIALAAIVHGADGLVSVTSNEVPHEMRTLVHGALEGRLADARALLNLGVLT